MKAPSDTIHNVTVFHISMKTDIAYNQRSICPKNSVC